MSLKDTLIDGSQKAKATRLSFGEELAILGAQNDKVVALDADLSKSTMTMLFAEKFPKRFFNMGIAEANMIGTAAGLAAAGMIPFAASFGCFLTGRFDQIRMSVAFTGMKVRLVGTHAGVGIGEDGHSQMALEDLTLMRSLPNMTVFHPADDEDTRNFMRWSLDFNGPCYMRLTRQGLPALKRPVKEFRPGHWDVLSTESFKEGAIYLLATGAMVGPTILAAEELLKAKSSRQIVIINANWIQPFDEVCLKKILAAKPGLLVTVEDHYRVGGLGGVVSEFMADQGVSARLLRIGVDGFGQSGSPEANNEHYGLTPKGIFQKIESELSRAKI